MTSLSRTIVDVIGRAAVGPQHQRLLYEEVGFCAGRQRGTTWHEDPDVLEWLELVVAGSRLSTADPAEYPEHWLEELLEVVRDAVAEVGTEAGSEPGAEGADGDYEDVLDGLLAGDGELTGTEAQWLHWFAERGEVELTDDGDVEQWVSVTVGEATGVDVVVGEAEPTR
ncbi:hypothetical protein [Streptomyces sp. NPDC059918]|uniref:hypothetical protein n=1 Tax=unclassified Streptomyces TaxID=2593676 RepID=UPI00365A1B76